METKKSEIERLLNDNLYSLDENTILKMNSSKKSGELNNVVVGIRKHCYGIFLNDANNEIIFQIFYVYGSTKLEGYLLELTLEMKYKDELVFMFSNFLSQNYEHLDFINTFNTFQEQITGMYEMIGFTTINSSFFNKVSSHETAFIAHNTKGIVVIHTINKEEFYKEFFEFKNMTKSEKECDYVYLMLNKRNNLIKIGKSKNPQFREKTLQADEPEIELIAFWQSTVQKERDLHKLFHHLRKRGEWFKLSFTELKVIKDQMAK